MDWKPILAEAGKGGFFRELEVLFSRMDRAWEDAARHCGFFCTGCEDNCCLTRFYHHTTIEYAYFIHGFRMLAPGWRVLCAKRAEAYNRAMDRALRENAPFSCMCPVNEDGLCLLYTFRPMICRLHGIPHELSPPGRAKIRGSGCARFDERCGHVRQTPLDRTPFYTELAALERHFREESGVSGKMKMTVAGMLVSAKEWTEEGTP